MWNLITSAVSKNKEGDSVNRSNVIKILGCVALCISMSSIGQARLRSLDTKNDRGVARGTINVIMGDENGLVVLTDSMLSQSGPDGKVHPLLRPAQKLFRLDSTSVCTIAGFTEAPIYFPGVEHGISAILQQYAAQLANRPTSLSLRAKRDELNFILENELSLIADIRNIPAEASQYKFQLTLAGYDTDRKARIVWSTLEITAPPGQSLGASWLVSVAESGEQEVSGRSLAIKIRGVNRLAEEILDRPDGYASDKAISRYRVSKEGGDSLSLEEMKSLSRALARETSLHYVGVGGDNQVAVLAHGSIIEWEQIVFPPEAYRTFNFNIIMDNIYDPIPEGDFVGPSQGVTNLYVHNGFQQTSVLLDDSYFASNTFTRSVVIYNGGRTLFAPNQDVSSSILAIGTKVDQKSDTASHLIKDFHWAKVITTDDALKIQVWRGLCPEKCP
jgi:hypothetical protein